MKWTKKKPDKIHALKTWIKYYKSLIDGDRTFEFRINDRNFKVGDLLLLQEYDNVKNEYTGENCLFKVTYILQDEFNLPKNYCIMSIKKVNLSLSDEPIQEPKGE